MERFIKEHEKEAYDLLLTIAKIPSPSNHEEKRAQFCCNWLKEQGAEGVYIDEALNVVYPAALRDNVDVYMAHTDVVFPDETELPLKVENGPLSRHAQGPGAEAHPAADAYAPVFFWQQNIRLL